MFYGIFIAIGIALVVALCFHVLKIPKLGNLILVTGGVKCGKTTLAVRLTLKQYRKQVFKWYVYCVLRKVLWFLKKPARKKPLIYSNIPLAVPYVPVTKAMLLREERFEYGSVIYLCEASLVADSQLCKDYAINEQLLLFNKLIGHETRGGYLIYDTQSISDNHYAVKRSLSQYLHVHHLTKLPFICLAWVKELAYSDDSSTVNAITDDFEEDLKCIVIPKSTWRKFDCYCYSALTDDLPVARSTKRARSRSELKARDIVSFRVFTKLFGGKRENVQTKDK